MLMTKERRTAIRTVRGWAIAVLQEAARAWIIDTSEGA